ncbi:zinc-binding dehydrogenase [Sediminibacillus halophilus]|uniref:Zinc-binding alcohol dehydrogenase/oxidoreductase n=1 Tax=Sediminibacillus halophilus TaxID=482461 RepID=A0A1G9N194_9BACI|nr:zinc-binding dehydrogenase [Sediminibacillus halophilus]SDL80249.1 zinc-binding alcohol dehydrogenase/oxidoreductase [Sediminibacillus halophilus]
MKAFVHQGDTLAYEEIKEPVAGKGMVKIKLKTAGLNHRDLNIPKRRGSQPEPLVLGSDGAGTVVETGEGVTRIKEGDEVILNPGLGWYHNSDAPPSGFEILGMPDNGTFAEYIVIAAEHVEKKPPFLTWEEAGVLALSGLTGYRALFTKGSIQSGQTLFIPGAGSGVATFLIQFAKAKGVRVIVSSRSEKKREKARDLGADRAIDTNGDWQEALAEEKIDLVIDSVGRATFNRSLDVLKKGGRLVSFGATTEDDITINIRKFFYGQYQLLGSTMGSREELRDMLRFMEEHKIRPVVGATFDLKEAKAAFDYLQEAKQFGKVAIRIN